MGAVTNPRVIIKGGGRTSDMWRTREPAYIRAGGRSTWGQRAPRKNLELISYDGFDLIEISTKRL